MDATVSRQMLRTLEPYHGMIYFVPEAAAEYERIGLLPGRMGYFASRAAPMGAVPADVVIATFFNFNPDLIRRSIPQAWALASPEVVTEARLRGADLALQRMLGDAVDSTEMREAADLARAATEACTPEGRPLYAGHASLEWPDAPHLVLWHAQTLLREYRGDGHIAAMVTERVSGLDALVIHGATGEVGRDVLQTTRAWSDEQWAAAVDGLRARGWLAPDGSLTDAGRASRDWVERRTDELMLPCWETLGDDRCARLRELVRPFSRAIVAQAFRDGSR